MSGIICIKLFGDLNYDSEFERIIKYLERKKYRFDILTSSEE